LKTGVLAQKLLFYPNSEIDDGLMPGKRSHYKRAFNFLCPKCGLKLLRLRRQKLSYKEPELIADLCGISLSTAHLIAATKDPTKKDACIEQFSCVKDGLQWLEIWQSSIDNSTHYLPLSSLCMDVRAECQLPEIS
jgi:predicted RNA-binding Zn-ribbon protein involved in translation (DUF1610 family)